MLGNKKKMRTNVLVTIALMGTISFIIELFKVKLPFFPSFLSLDVSDVPAILTSFYLGPVSGFTVEGIKILLKLFLTGTSTAGVGELSNFIMGCVLCLPVGLAAKNTRSNKALSDKRLIIGLILGAISFCIVGIISNNFLIMPIYTKIMGEQAIINAAQMINPNWDNLNTIIIAGVTPFNALKSILSCIIAFLIHRLLPAKLKNDIMGKK